MLALGGVDYPSRPRRENFFQGADECTLNSLAPLEVPLDNSDEVVNLDIPLLEWCARVCGADGELGIGVSAAASRR
jgi:hypothetical protein